jgi:hypothetical protein
MAWPWLRRLIKVTQDEGIDRFRLLKGLGVIGLALRAEACSNC